MGKRKNGGILDVVRLLMKQSINRLNRFALKARQIQRRLPYPRVIASMLLIAFLLSFVPGIYIGKNNQKAGAAGTIAFGVATTANNDQGNSVTINKSSLTVTGDLLIATVMIQGRNPTITIPSGWADFPTPVKFTVNATTTTTMAAYYKIATASEPASYTFSEAGGPSTRWVGAISVYKGVDNTTPIEAQSTTNFGTGVSAAANAVTSVSTNARIVSVFGVEFDAPTSFTPPTTAKERYDVGSTRSGVGNTDVTISSADITQFTAGGGNGKTATAASADNFGAFQFALKPDGVIRMFLFWDGGAAPTGWSIIDDYDGQFPRGAGANDFGDPVESTRTVHTVSAATTNINGMAGNQFDSGGNTPAVSTSGHTHSVSGSISFSAPKYGANVNHTDEPAYCTLKLIRYNSGVPNVIPAGAIAIFDNSPGIPGIGGNPGSGWSQVTARNGKFIKVDSTTSSCATKDGGSDSHYHDITWPGFNNSSGSINYAGLLANQSTANATHTHSTPAGTTTMTNNTDACRNDTAAVPTCLPPYVEPLLGKSTSDTPTLSVGLTAIFDGDPGGGWVLRSDSTHDPASRPFAGQFMRPAATFNPNTQGSANHTHANATSGASGGNSATGNQTRNLIGNQIAGNGHTHSITTTFNSAEQMPDYFNIVIAEKVNFILEAYYWYEDNDALTPTNKWGNPDYIQSTPISALPLVTHTPPDLTTELRLRLQLKINGNNLTADVVRYRLQYNELLSEDCTDPSGSWIDVAESSSNDAAWRFANSTVTGESQLSSPSTIFTPNSTVMGRYVKSNIGTTNNPGATIGDYIEYDFHIEHNAANGGSRYSFRIIEDSGTLLSEYKACPTLITRPRTENQMRHGNFFLGGSGDPNANAIIEQGYSWND